jgi:hypothetical protein
MADNFIVFKLCGTALYYNAVSSVKSCNFCLECRRGNIIGGVVEFYVNYNSRFDLSSEILPFTRLASDELTLYSIH